MLVFEFFFALSALTCLGIGQMFIAGLLLACYLTLILTQKNCSVWAVILAVVICAIHLLWLRQLGSGCWFVSDGSMNAIHPVAGKHWLAPGWYFGCDLFSAQVSFSKVFDLRAALQNELQGWSMHPVISYFLFGFAQDAYHEKSILIASGLVHLMSVSGLHVEIIARFIGKCVAFIWPQGLLRYLTVLVVLLIYGFIVGYAVPVQRAIIMYACRQYGRIRGLNLSSMLSWQIALLLVLIINPLVMFMASFYLSFALAWVLSLSHPQKDSFFAAAVMILSMWFFHFFPPQALLLNRVLLPVYECLLLWVLIVGYIAIVWQEKLLLAGPSIAFEIIDQLLGKWYPLGWVVDEYGYWACALVAAFFIWYWLKQWQVLLFVMTCMICAQFLSNSVPYGEFQMMTYDVGHGLMILVRTQHHDLIYDSPSAKQFVQQLEKKLHQRAYHQPLLMISHSDRDHSGALPFIQKKYPRAPLISNLSIRARDHTCFAGHEFLVDGVRFEFLTMGDLTVRGNAASCVLLIHSASGTRTLLTGDIEPSWQKEYASMQVMSSLLPHHGRASQWFQAMVGSSVFLLSDSGSGKAPN